MYTSNRRKISSNYFFKKNCVTVEFDSKKWCIHCTVWALASTNIAMCHLLTKKKALQTSTTIIIILLSSLAVESIPTLYRLDEINLGVVEEVTSPGL